MTTEKTPHKPSFRDRLIERIVTPVGKHIDKIDDLIEQNIPPRVLEKIVQGAILKRTSVVLVFNHQSHGDIFLTGKLTEFLTQKINEAISSGQHEDARKDPVEGFSMPMAISVATGDQSSIITHLFNQVEPWCENHNLYLEGIPREKDIAKYNLPPTSGLRAAARLIRKVKSCTCGLAIYLEGTTTGGKRKHVFFGPRNGMQDLPDQTLVSRLVFEAQAIDLNLMIVPVGLTGGVDIFNPNIRLPTARAVRAVIASTENQRLLGKIAVGAVKATIPSSFEHQFLGSVNVGEPFFADELFIPEFEGRKPPKFLHHSINRQVFMRVAELVSPENRGVYADALSFFC